MSDSPTPRPRIFVLDSMAYIFRSFFAIRYPMTAENGTPTNALFGFIRAIEKIMKDFNPSHIIATQDPGGPTFRHEMFPEYKANRSECPEELKPQFELINRYLDLRGIPIIKRDGLEADDIIGAICIEAEKLGMDAIICSADKDLMQLITDHVSMCQTHKENLMITPANVGDIMGVRPEQIIDYLAMMGDAADNIPGLPGIGPKTAAKLLGEHGTLQTLLDNPELGGTKRLTKIIAENTEKVLLSKELVTLKVDIELETSPMDFVQTETKWDELEQFCQDMRLRQILTDFKKTRARSGVITPSITSDGTVTTPVAAPVEVTIEQALKDSELIELNLLTYSTKPLKYDLLQFELKSKGHEFDLLDSGDEKNPNNLSQALLPLREKGLTGEIILTHNGVELDWKEIRAAKEKNISIESMILSWIADLEYIEDIIDAQFNPLTMIPQWQAGEFDTILQESITDIDGIKVKYKTVESLIDLEKLLTKITTKKKSISFDFETTGLDPRSCQLVGLGLCQVAGTAFYIPFNHPAMPREEVLALLRPFFESKKNFFYAQNAKYDIEVLWENSGIRIKNIDFDTLIASYLLHPERNWQNLDGLCLHLLNYNKIETKSLIGTGKKQTTMDLLPIEQVSRYCCEDVDFTLRLREKLEPALKAAKLDKLLNEIELPSMRVLAYMETRGIYADAEVLADISSKLGDRAKALKDQILELAGEEFNLNSPKQVGTILFEKLGLKGGKKTATGFSTSQDVLEKLADEHEMPKLLLQYRVLTKLLSTYADSLPTQIAEKTGRIHTHFSQTTAATGRLSSTQPNLQNIPVRSEEGRMIRSAFKAAPGHRLLSCDYSQIELRVLAHMSGDEELTKAFNENFDVHTYTASLVFGIPYDEVSKNQRYQAKAVNFGIIYGQGKYGLAKEIGVTADEAAKFIADYFQRYPKIRNFMDECKHSAVEKGYSTTFLGRRRYIPEIYSSRGFIRQNGERISVNSPIQGAAADIIKIAMIAVHAMLEEKFPASKILLQIHDELLLEVPESELEAVETAVVESMANCIELSVPLKVDAATALAWSECD